MAGTCADCFYVKSEIITRAGVQARGVSNSITVLSCRFWPPNSSGLAAVKGNKGADSTRVRSGWSRVNPDDWCGQYSVDGEPRFGVTDPAQITVPVPSVNVEAASPVVVPAPVVNVEAASPVVVPASQVTVNAPKGDKGDPGEQGGAGVNAFGSPAAIAPAFGAAYQAAVPAKPAIISAMVETVYSITLAGTQADTVELRIGPVQATVANGSGGFAVATYRNSLTGIALSIGMGTVNRNQLSAFLPVGWYYALRRVAGTVATITSATDQAVG